jgi:hypothetical protein
MSRKRRRSQAVSAEEQHNADADAMINGEGHDSAERRKEHEIWDTFKEEHHEGTPVISC